MGASYGTIYLRSQDPARVRAALNEVANRDRQFFLGPNLDGWLAVYPKGHGQDVETVELVAQKVGGRVLYVYVHDESVFGYVSYVDGRQVDEYCSYPDFFEEVPAADRERLRGRPAELARDFGRPEEGAELDRLLHPPGGGGPASGSLALRTFARLLGLPNALVSYEDLRDLEDLGEGQRFRFLAVPFWCWLWGMRGWSKFTHVPDRTDAWRRERTRGAGRKTRIQQLVDSGRLLLHQPGRRGWVLNTSPHVGPNRAGNGFFVTWENAAQDRLLDYAPPWPIGGRPTELEVDRGAERLRLSPSGRYLALGWCVNPARVEVWDLDHGVPVAAAKTDFVAALDFSRDERFLAAITHGELIVFDLPGKAVVKRGKLPSSVSNGIFDPTGEFIVCAVNEELRLVDWQTGTTTRRWLLGRRRDMRLELLALREQLREASDANALEQAERHARRLATKYHLPAREARNMIQAMRSLHWKMQARLDDPDVLEQIASAGAESATGLHFSADGRWLMCGTDQGARVYEWQRFLATVPETPAEPPGRKPAQVSAPAPHYAVAGVPYQEEGEDEYEGSGQYVYATAYDREGEQFLFGGLGGAVESLDLRTGAVRTLLELPGRPAVMQLVLSRDRKALAWVAQPHFYRSTPKLAPELWIGDYAALGENAS